MVVMFLQFLKADMPMVYRISGDVGKVTDVKLPQASKASCPIEVQLDRLTEPVMPLQP